jgi:hypothetical protein
MPVIAASRVRALLPSLTGTAEDSAIEVLIEAADSQIAHYLRIPETDAGGRTLGSSTYTLTHPDIVLTSPRIVYLPLLGITAITSLHTSESQVFDSSSLVSSDDYRLDARTGAIRLKPTATNLSETDGDVQVVAVAGWATLPDDLAQAVAMHARHLWSLRRTQGATSTSEAGVSMSLRDETIPAAVAEILAPHRRMLL